MAIKVALCVCLSVCVCASSLQWDCALHQQIDVPLSRAGGYTDSLTHTHTHTQRTTLPPPLETCTWPWAETVRDSKKREGARGGRFSLLSGWQNQTEDICVTCVHRNVSKWLKLNIFFLNGTIWRWKGNNKVSGNFPTEGVSSNRLGHRTVSLTSIWPAVVCADDEELQTPLKLVLKTL